MSFTQLLTLLTIQFWSSAAKAVRVENPKQLLTMDILALATMKNAAKCDT